MKKIKCFDMSHADDVVRECKDSPTLCARMGTGGNNVPIVLMDQGGDVMNVEVDKVGTLRAQTHGPYQSFAGLGNGLTKLLEEKIHDV